MATVHLALARGAPFADAGSEASGTGFTAGLARRLTQLHRSAREDLVRCHAEIGSADRALPVAESLAADYPDDEDAAQLLKSVRERLQKPQGEVLRNEFPGLGVEVVIVAGELFDEQLIGPSSAAWGRHPGDYGRVAYVTTDGGLIAPPTDDIVRPARLLRAELPAPDIAGHDQGA